jgi:hypothetical protein
MRHYSVHEMPYSASSAVPCVIHHHFGLKFVYNVCTIAVYCYALLMLQANKEEVRPVLEKLSKERVKANSSSKESSKLVDAVAELANRLDDIESQQFNSALVSRVEDLEASTRQQKVRYWRSCVLYLLLL